MVGASSLLPDGGPLEFWNFLQALEQIKWFANYAESLADTGSGLKGFLVVVGKAFSVGYTPERSGCEDVRNVCCVPVFYYRGYFAFSYRLSVPCLGHVFDVCCSRSKRSY